MNTEVCSECGTRRPAEEIVNGRCRLARCSEGGEPLVLAGPGGDYVRRVLCGVTIVVRGSYALWVEALADGPAKGETREAWWKRCEDLHQQYRKEQNCDD